MLQMRFRRRGGVAVSLLVQPRFRRSSWGGVPVPRPRLSSLSAALALALLPPFSCGVRTMLLPRFRRFGGVPGARVEQSSHGRTWVPFSTAYAIMRRIRDWIPRIFALVVDILLIGCVDMNNRTK